MAVRRAQALWITGPYEATLRSEPLPTPRAGDVLVEALYSAVHRGGEGPVCAGRVGPEEAPCFRVPFQAGTFPHPVKYGFASVGRVLEGPAELVGRTVFCPHPHQSHYVVPADAVVPLPREVAPRRAVLAAAMATALEALRRGGPRPGERVVVVGAGLVGTLCAWLLRRMPAVETVLVDIDPDRRRLAEALDLPFALPEEVMGEADLVVHASGAPEALVRACSWAGEEGRLVEVSRYAGGTVPLPLGRHFCERRLSLTAVRVDLLGREPHPRWSARRRLAKALELLGDSLLDLVFTGESRFEDLPRLLPDLARDGRGVLAHRIVYPAAAAA